MTKSFLALLGGASAIAAASTGAAGAMAQADYCGPNGCAGTTSGQRVTTYSGPNGTTYGAPGVTTYTTPYGAPARPIPGRRVNCYSTPYEGPSATNQRRNTIAA